MGKCGCFFSARQLISRGKSHISLVRGLVVRCLLFNPEVSWSNPWVCAYFFTSISRQKVLTFFGTETFRLCETFFRNFLNVPKSPPFNFLMFCNRTNVKNSKESLFQIFRHYETAIKISHFLFFENFLLKTPKSPPSILQQNGC